MSPKVAIIVPVYNQEKYLRKCLDSLVNQTFRDIEIICFNDASTDSSLSILKEYAAKDSRITLIDNKINIKQGGGRNAGIRKSTAPYIMFVDSDDWVEKNFVEKYYTKVIETEADIVNGNYNLVDHGKIQRIHNLGNKINGTTDFYKREHLEANVYIWTNLYNRNLFFDNDLFFPEGVQLCEDNAVSSALFLAAKKIVRVDEYLYNYRIISNSSSHEYSPSRFKDRFKSALIAKENLLRIDSANRYTDQINQLFINSYYRNPIQNALGAFDKVLVDEIRFANRTITNYVSKQDLHKFISHLSISERIIFISLQKSIYLGIAIFKTYNAISRLKEKLT